MALKVVVAGQLYSQITAYVRSCADKDRRFVLAMLIPSDVGLSERWNFVVSAPWIDQAGLTAAIPDITSSLQKFLSKANARKIDRVSVLPTADTLVKELSPLAIEPGTAYRVSTFALTARGIEDAVVFAAQRPYTPHIRQNHVLRSRA